MKNLVLAFALLSSSLIATFSTVASARSMDPTPVVATVEGQYGNVKSIALLADGRLQAQLLSGKVIQDVLPELVFKKLIGTAQNLANAKIKTSHSQVICMMMPIGDLDYLAVASYDEANQKFTGKPHMVLTPQGCYVSDKAIPADRYNENSAFEFRGQLVVLALTLAK